MNHNSTLYRCAWRTTLSLLALGLMIGCNNKPTPSSNPNPPAPKELGKEGPSPTLASDPNKPDGLAPADADQVAFKEITAEAGIDFTHFSGARGKKYMPECETPGCAFLDYDGDGKPDILLLNGADWPEVTSGRKHTTCKLYHNEGNGKFKDVTQGSGLDIEMHTMGVAIGDYDNDGKDDIYISCIMGPSRLFHNEGNGHFKEVTTESGVNNEGLWGSAVAWLDYDHDGKLDLLVGNYCKWTPQTDQFCSVYKGKKSYCTPNVYDGVSLRLYHNEGGGKFKDVSKQAGFVNLAGKTWGFAILDYDNDGWEDVAVSNDMEPNLLFHNMKNGTFQEVGMGVGIALGENGAPKAGMGIDSGDIDNSGRESILVSNFSGEGLSFFYNGDGKLFYERSGQTEMSKSSLLRMGWGLFFFDYDLDGRKDALVCNGHLYENVQDFQPDVHFMETPLLYHNKAPLKFEEVCAKKGDLARPVVARGCSYADIDGDGDLDVLVMTLDGKAHLYRNDGGNKNHWLRIQLIGKKSNRNGYGAKIEVTAKGVTQLYRVRSGSSFLSALEQIATVGMGTEAQAEQVKITWNTGQVDTYSQVGTDALLVATEGEGAVAYPKQDRKATPLPYARK